MSIQDYDERLLFMTMVNKSLGGIDESEPPYFPIAVLKALTITTIIQSPSCHVLNLSMRL